MRSQLPCKLPEMVFLLASPRSGSTLLRVMLAGHPELFSPPELNLLPFCSMAEREVRLGALANCVMPCDPRVGLTEAVMHLTGDDPDTIDHWLRPWVDRDIPVAWMFHALREMAAPRRLVDKASLNSSCVAFLEKAHQISPAAHFIHLVRHPYAAIESLRRTYLNRVPGPEAFQMAEDLWATPNVNILRFLHTVARDHQLFVRFEDLVREPDAVMERICEFLAIPFHPEILNPYERGRMTEGSPGRFDSLGDPHFNRHDHIDATLGDAWQRIELSSEMSPAAVELAAYFQYTLRQPCALSRLQERGSNQVLLVVPPYTYRTEAYCDAARRLGLSPVCALDPSHGVPPGVNQYLPVSFDEPECAARKMTRYAQSNSVRGIVAVDDAGADIAALAAEALQFPYNRFEAFSTTHNKYAMRMRLSEANVPSPKFTVHRVCEDSLRIAGRIKYPVVLKPLHLSGSRGVIRADNADEFVAAFARIARLLEQPGTGPEPKRLLVEEYIHGAEVSVDGIMDQGRLRVLAVFDKPDPLEGPFFEETLFVTPSRHAPEVQDQIVACAERAVRAIGIDIGPVHVELRINEHGPWMLELAARTMGGFCSRALPFQGGHTLEELVLSQAARLPINRFQPAPGAHGVMMIPIPEKGIYRGVIGTRDAEAVPGITGVMITMPIDHVVVPLPEGEKYMGFIFADGDSPNFVENSLREAHHRLKFSLDPVVNAWLRIGPSVHGTHWG